MKMIPVKQGGTGGKVAKQNTNTGSGSRPGTKGSFPIPSSAPAHAKRHKG